MTSQGRFASLAAFLSSIRGDLANITSPPAFLAPESVVEICTCWAERPALFSAGAREPNPERRALAVLKWYLASHRRQFYVGANVTAGLKKPLNAFLGEIFLGKWSDDVTTVRTVTEQVSHHPPVTACYMVDEKSGVWGEGYSRVDMTFTGVLNVKQTGHSLFYIEPFQEQILVPFPDFQVKGFFTGHLYPEISGTYSIVSSSGLVSEITYSGKGFFKGTKNHFEAKIYRREDPSRTPIYTVSGCWSGKWAVHDGITGKEIEVWVPEEHPASPLEETPLEEQGPWETRFAWKEVISALKAKEFPRAGAEKLKVEEAQRRLRTADPKYVANWEPLFFSASNEKRPDFDALASAVPGWKLEAERTQGNWRFDEKKADNAKKPYHGDLTPMGRV